MELKEVIESRRSVKKYDTDYKIDDATFKTLFDRVRLSPSSSNLQHWKFVVVRDAEHQKTLREAAFNQAQVEEASAAIVVCGNLKAYKDAERIYAETPKEVREYMVPMIHKSYEGKDQFQRDEAIRSGALAAMTLMLAAKDMGLATGPMIGFDPEAVSKIIHLDADHIPVMMVVIGRQVGDMRPRAYRRPLEEIVKFETLDGAGFS
jgi:nitroreductase